MLTSVSSRKSLPLDVASRLTGEEPLERMSDLIVRRGLPRHICIDNGPEFIARWVRSWLGRFGVGTVSIDPGSPSEGGCIELFSGKLSGEPLDRESFDTFFSAIALALSLGDIPCRLTETQVPSEI